jgi:hypothetical protein
MNLHSIVAPYVGTVNPPLLCSLQSSTGYTTSNYGRTPTYAAPVNVEVQCQALSYSDLRMLDSLNISGKRLAGYLTGNWDGVVRSETKGGDLVTLPDGSIWLCAYVLENWSLSSGWTKVCLTLQNNA